MKKLSKDSKKLKTQNPELVITVQASEVTNGTGGGAILEGSYSVYMCAGGGVPIRPFGPPFCS